MLSVMNGECNLLATTWEWKEDIDEARADAAKKRAQEMIERKGLSEREYKLAEAKLKRALVRLSVKG
jgi:F-type H+-transporting ATPase subunit epsilon